MSLQLYVLQDMQEWLCLRKWSDILIRQTELVIMFYLKTIPGKMTKYGHIYGHVLISVPMMSNITPNSVLYEV